MTDTSWVLGRRRGRPPSSDSALTRERILHAAREIFAEVGFEAATFHAIATRAGLTRPAINNYFASKSLLYREVMCRTSNGVLEGIHEASAAPTLGGQIVEFIQVAILSQGADPSVAGFLVQAALQAKRRPELGGGDSDAVMLIEQFVRGSVAAADQRGELASGPDTDALTDTLIGVVWGMAFQISSSGSRDGRRVVDEVNRLLTRGLLRDP